MESRRFDSLAKALATASDRRRLIGGLVGAALGGGIGPGLDRAGAKRKKGAPCPKKPYDRCAKPVIDALLAANDSCQPRCIDPNSEICRACIDPAISEATRGIAACLAQVCRGGTGPETGAAEAMTAESGTSAAAKSPGASCNSAEYDKCVDRNNRNLYYCLGPALPACWAAPLACSAVAVCMAQARAGGDDCVADHGCKGKGFCKQNVCCPDWADVVCNGVCCQTRKCEQCVNGVCQGCGKEQVCTVSPGQTRECGCTRNRHACGQQCCDQWACRECVDGACKFTCTSPKVCVPGQFSGSCECHPNDEECGETCCVADKCEECDGAGNCRSRCGPGQVCKDRKCVCPSGTKPCGAKNCCGAGQVCFSDGSCGCIDATPCGTHCCNTSAGEQCCPGADTCCQANEFCDNGACTENPCQTPPRTKRCKSNRGDYSFCCPPCAECCSGQSGGDRCCQPSSCKATCQDGFCVGGTQSCPCQW